MLRYKEPAVRWINEADPYNDDPGITVESANEERTVYLIRDQDAETADLIEEWIKFNYEALFESELDDWYMDEVLRPQNRGIELFYKWFDVELHSVIVDTVDAPIKDVET